MGQRVSIATGAKHGLEQGLGPAIEPLPERFTVDGAWCCRAVVELRTVSRSITSDITRDAGELGRVGPDLDGRNRPPEPVGAYSARHE